ncbi:MAG: STAS/SEC14 domain-containing protein [Thermodesulfobacteriota bacterium]
MFEVLGGFGAGTLGLRLSGRLGRGDVRAMDGLVEEALGGAATLRVLVVVDGLQGFAAGALWKDLVPAARHLARIRRVAVVGGREWEGWWEALVARGPPEGTGGAVPALPRVRFFEGQEAEAARRWLGAEDKEG